MLKIIEKRGRFCVRYETGQRKFGTLKEAEDFILSKEPAVQLDLPLVFEKAELVELESWNNE